MRKFFCQGRIIFFSDLKHYLDHDRDRWGEEGYYDVCNYISHETLIQPSSVSPTRLSLHSDVAGNITGEEVPEATYTIPKLVIPPIGKSHAYWEPREIVVQRTPYWDGLLCITPLHKLSLHKPRIKQWN